MAMETCACGVRFAVGLLRCPRCGTVAPLYADRLKDATPTVRGADVALSSPGAYVDMPFRQLRALAKSRGLSGAGTGAELAARLEEADGGDAP